MKTQTYVVKTSRGDHHEESGLWPHLARTIMDVTLDMQALLPWSDPSRVNGSG